MEKALKAQSSIKDYILLTKPGIIMGNLVTAVGGFALAGRALFDLALFIGMLEGLALVIGAACIFNNIIDRNHDAKMERTKYRALARGVILVRSAGLFGTLLLLSGAFILGVATNFLIMLVALIGVFFYVVVYSLSKYQTSYGTLIGTIAGSIPPVVGYVAVTGRLDLGALLIFLIVAMWQMPHFFAIAIYRLSDYAKASIPVFPIAHGMHKTKVHMTLYLSLFIGACATLTLTGYTTTLFMIIMGAVGALWLFVAIKGFKAKNDLVWGRKMFIFSLVVIMVLSLIIPFTTVV